MSAASIMIYLPDDSALQRYLELMEAWGFHEIDWCELRSEDDPGVVISYGPCEPMPEDR